eukprot:2791911-Rhodomonas_salina.1
MNALIQLIGLSFRVSHVSWSMFCEPERSKDCLGEHVNISTDGEPQKTDKSHEVVLSSAAISCGSKSLCCQVDGDSGSPSPPSAHLPALAPSSLPLYHRCSDERQ